MKTAPSYPSSPSEFTLLGVKNVFGCNGVVLGEMKKGPFRVEYKTRPSGKKRILVAMLAPLSLNPPCIFVDVKPAGCAAHRPAHKHTKASTAQSSTRNILCELEGCDNDNANGP